MLKIDLKAYTAAEVLLDKEIEPEDMTIKTVSRCDIWESLVLPDIGVKMQLTASVKRYDNSSEILPSSLQIGSSIDIVITATEDGLLAPVIRRFRGVILGYTVVPPEDGFQDAEEVLTAFVLGSSILNLKQHSLFKVYSDCSPIELVRQMISDTIGDQSVGVSAPSALSQVDNIPYLIQTGDNCWRFLTSVLAERGISFMTIPKQGGGEVVHLVYGGSQDIIEDVNLEVGRWSGVSSESANQEEKEGGTGTGTTTLEEEEEEEEDVDDGIPDTLGEVSYRGLTRLFALGHGSNITYEFKHGLVKKLTAAGSPDNGGVSFSVTGGVKSVMATGVTSLQQGGDSKGEDIRFESIRCRAWRVFLGSITPSFQVAQKLVLTEPTNVFGTDTDREVFIERVFHRFENGRYGNIITARDGNVPWRPPMPDSRGKGRSLCPTVTGRVHGEAGANDGDPVPFDQYGQVPVVCLWDTEVAGVTGTGPSSSCVLRLRALQVTGGSEHGVKFEFRHGDEVVVQMLNGRPDEAVITGRVGRKGGETPVYQVISSGGFTVESLEQNEEVVDKDGVVKLDANGDPETELTIKNMAFLLFKRPISEISPPAVTDPPSELPDSDVSRSGTTS